MPRSNPRAPRPRHRIKDRLELEREKDESERAEAAMRNLSACVKKAYGTREVANEALDQCRQKGRPETRTYQCWRCNRWHLTSDK